MEYVLVSACLLGQPVRYDGRSVPHEDTVLTAWQRAGRVIPVCPEVAGGLPIPRPAAEIQPGVSAADVMAGRGRVIAVSGEDVTSPFICGAQAALAVAQRHSIKLAVLKEGSPSCGSSYVYDGRFTRQRQPGLGLTAQALTAAGIRVFSEHQWAQAQAWLQELESQSRPT